jgi:hypothetical protein
MESLIDSFLPLSALALRLLALIALYSTTGFFLAGAVHRKPGGIPESPGRFFLWLPLGWLSFCIASFFYLRLAQWSEIHTNLAVITGAAWATLFGVIVVRHRNPGGRLELAENLREVRRAGGTALLVLATALVSASYCLLPLILDRQVRFYAGTGTDALGYIRVSQSVANGSYFQPVPPPSDFQLVHHPALSWVYAVMESKQRPGAYLYTAMTSRMVLVNDFQGYLCAACILVAVLCHFLCYLLGSARIAGPKYLLLVALALVLMLSTGMTGNFYHQYFAHCMAIIGIVVAGGILGGIASAARAGTWGQAGAGFAVVLFTGMAYDFRHGILAVACLVLASFISRPAGGGRLPGLLRCTVSMLAGGAAALIYVTPRHHWTESLAPRLFPTEFSLQTFAAESAFWDASRFPVLALAGITAVAIVGMCFWRGLSRCSLESPPLRFGIAYNSVALVLCSLLTAWLVILHNEWAAMKMLYVVLAAGIIQLLLYLAALFGAAGRQSRLAALLLTGLLGGLAVVSWRTNLRAARGIVQYDTSVIRADGILAALRGLNGSQVKRVSLVASEDIRYLILITLLDGTGLPIDTKYDLWKAGGGSRFGPEQAAKDYARLFHNAAWRQGSPVYCITELGMKTGLGLHRSSQVNFGVLSEDDPLRSPREYTLGVVLPEEHLKGSEPLLACGRRGAGLVIFLTYLDGGVFRIGIDRWGVPSILSEPLSREALTGAPLTIRLDDNENRVAVIANRQLVLAAKVPLDFPDTGEVVFGKNHIGATTTDRDFRGVLRVLTTGR